MSSAHNVMKRALDLNLHGIVDLLIAGYVDYKLELKLLDLLLLMYTKGRWLSRRSRPFIRWSGMGCCPMSRTAIGFFGV